MKECNTSKSAIVKNYSLIIQKIIMGWFEDLIIRKQAEKLTVEIYTIFKDLKDYGFKDQIQRASVSIMNNIAEWNDRETSKDRIRFFVMAKWSCVEVRSMIHLWHTLQYIDWEVYEKLKALCLNLNVMISKFIKNIP